jgi:hypothetical protein
MAVVGIDYEGGDYIYDEDGEPTVDENGNRISTPIEYKCVRISYGNGMKHTKEFKSGDFVKDWYDCNKFILTELADTEYGFANSSTVDHFLMDGAPYDSAYLYVKDDVAELKYGNDWYSRGVEFFVKEGTTPTWDELREICGDPKK